MRRGSHRRATESPALASSSGAQQAAQSSDSAYSATESNLAPSTHCCVTRNKSLTHVPGPSLSCWQCKCFAVTVIT